MIDTTVTIPSRRGFLSLAGAAVAACFVKAELATAATMPAVPAITDGASCIVMWRSFGADVIDCSPFGIAVYYDKADRLPRDAVRLEAEWKARTPDWRDELKRALNA